MLNMKAVIAAWAVLVMAALSAGAAMPTPPDELIGEDAFLVISISGDQATPDALRAAAQVVLGKDAAMAKGPLDQFQQLYDRATQADVRAVCLVAQIDADGHGGVIMLDFKLKPGADPAAVQNLNPWKGMVGGQQAASHRINGDLVFLPPNQSLPAAPSPARAKIFKEAIAAAGDQSMVVVLAPTRFIRDSFSRMMSHTPPDIKAVGADLLNSQWTSLAVTSGAAPELKVTTQQPDAASAARLLREFPKAIARVKGLFRIDHAPPMQHRPLHTAVERLDEALRSVELKQHDTQVSLTADTKVLTKFAAAAVPLVEIERERGKDMQSMSNMRRLSQGLIMYASDHHGNLPDTLDQMPTYFGGEEGLAMLMTNPRTGDKPGYLYVKPAAQKMFQIKHPDTVPLIYELRNGKKDPTGFIAYVDGHVAKAPRSSSTAPSPRP